ncbi:MAG: SGNH/GDSL hydrolase family protein [Pseudomonadota bacterium]
MSLAAIRIALGPLLLTQGRRVRRDILRLPEAEGPREGIVGEGPPLRLLVLGDSSAAGVGAATQSDALVGQLVAQLSPEYRTAWTVIARTGWTTADARSALADDPSLKADLVVLCLGVNDITTETGIARWLDSYVGLSQDLRDRGARLILASAMPPMGSFPALPQPLRWYLGRQAEAHDRALADWAAETADVRHVPLDLTLGIDAMAEDGFHPGPEVYAVWADALKAGIEANRARLP